MDVPFGTVSNTNYNKCKPIIRKVKDVVSLTEKVGPQAAPGASEFKAYSPLPFPSLIGGSYEHTYQLTSTTPIYVYLHLLEKIPAGESFSASNFRVFITDFNANDNIQVAIYQLTGSAIIGDNATYNGNSVQVAVSSLTTITANGFLDIPFNSPVVLDSAPDKNYFIAFYSNAPATMLTNIYPGDPTKEDYIYSGQPTQPALTDPSQNTINVPDGMANVDACFYYALWR